MFYKIRPYAVKIIVIAAVFLLANTTTSRAIDDGFVSEKKVEGKYCTIYCAGTVELPALIQSLNVGLPEKIISGERSETPFSYSQKELADMVDALFLQVLDILDMHLYSFHLTVKVPADQAGLDAIYNNYFEKPLGGRFSFYVYDVNTVYISAENFRKEVLGHEIAHSVINHYFVVAPPVKIQEVLAMYVEYQLRRK